MVYIVSFSMVSLLLLLSFVSYYSEAHTWIDCIDTDRTKVYDNSKQYIFGGSGGNGYCEGYGAGYPGRGDIDIGTGYTYKMLKNEVEAGTPVCESVGANTYTDWRKRISLAPGQTAYFGYLPNGHIVKDKKAVGTKHGVYWTGKPGTALTSTLDMKPENLLNGNMMNYDDGNCGETVDYQGKPSGRAGDGKPCVGSFSIPVGTASGIYKMVWFWKFWLDDEDSYVDQDQAKGYFGAAYSTCFEVEVTSDKTAASKTPPSPADTPKPAPPQTPAPPPAPAQKTPPSPADTPKPAPPQTPAPPPAPAPQTPAPTPSPSTPAPKKAEKAKAPPAPPVSKKTPEVGGEAEAKAPPAPPASKKIPEVAGEAEAKPKAEDDFAVGTVGPAQLDVYDEENLPVTINEQGDAGETVDEIKKKSDSVMTGTSSDSLKDSTGLDSVNATSDALEETETEDTTGVDLEGSTLDETQTEENGSLDATIGDVEEDSGSVGLDYPTDAEDVSQVEQEESSAGSESDLEGIASKIKQRSSANSITRSKRWLVLSVAFLLGAVV